MRKLQVECCEAVEEFAIRMGHVTIFTFHVIYGEALAKVNTAWNRLRIACDQYTGEHINDYHEYCLLAQTVVGKCFLFTLYDSDGWKKLFIPSEFVDMVKLLRTYLDAHDVYVVDQTRRKEIINSKILDIYELDRMGCPCEDYIPLLTSIGKDSERVFCPSYHAELIEFVDSYRHKFESIGPKT